MEFILDTIEVNNRVGLFSLKGIIVEHKGEKLDFPRPPQGTYKSIRFMSQTSMFEPLNVFLSNCPKQDLDVAWKTLKEINVHVGFKSNTTSLEKVNAINLAIKRLLSIFPLTQFFAFCSAYANFYLPDRKEETEYSTFKDKDLRQINAIFLMLQLVSPIIISLDEVIKAVVTPRESKRSILSRVVEASKIDREDIWEKILTLVHEQKEQPFPTSMVHAGIDEAAFIDYILAEIFIARNLFMELNEAEYTNIKGTRRPNLAITRLKKRTQEAYVALPKYFGDEVDLMVSPKESGREDDNTSRNEQATGKEKLPKTEAVDANVALSRLDLVEETVGVTINPAVLKTMVAWAVNNEMDYNEGQTFLVRTALTGVLEPEQIDLLRLQQEHNAVGYTAALLDELGYPDLVRWLFSEIDIDAGLGDTSTLPRQIKDFTISDTCRKRLAIHYTSVDILEDVVTWIKETTSQYLTGRIRRECSPIIEGKTYRSNVPLIVGIDFKEQLANFLCDILDLNETRTLKLEKELNYTL